MSETEQAVAEPEGQPEKVERRGGRREGAGRKPGVPNKTTTTMRAAFTLFVEANIPKFQKLLDRVAEKDPGEALNIVARFSEFCLPKLMRAEVTGEDGAALIPPTLSISFASGGPGFGNGLLSQSTGDEEPDVDAPTATAGDGTAESEAAGSVLPTEL
jgi:hypothetical protein